MSRTVTVERAAIEIQSSEYDKLDADKKAAVMRCIQRGMFVPNPQFSGDTPLIQGQGVSTDPPGAELADAEKLVFRGALPFRIEVTRSKERGEIVEATLVWLDVNWP